MPLKNDMYILKILPNIGTFAYVIIAIKNDIVSPSSIANRDNLIVTVLYLSIIGIILAINLMSKFTKITYSSDFVVSIPNHLTDNSPNVPSSLIAFNALDTSCESFVPSSPFLNGYAFTS